MYLEKNCFKDVRSWYCLSYFDFLKKKSGQKRGSVFLMELLVTKLGNQSSQEMSQNVFKKSSFSV